MQPLQHSEAERFVLLAPRIADGSAVWIGGDIAEFGTVEQLYGYAETSPVYVTRRADGSLSIIHDCAVIDVSAVDPSRLCRGGNA